MSRNTKLAYKSAVGLGLIRLGCLVVILGLCSSCVALPRYPGQSAAPVKLPIDGVWSPEKKYIADRWLLADSSMYCLDSKGQSASMPIAQLIANTQQDFAGMLFAKNIKPSGADKYTCEALEEKSLKLTFVPAEITILPGPVLLFRKHPDDPKRSGSAFKTGMLSDIDVQFRCLGLKDAVLLKKKHGSK